VRMRLGISCLAESWCCLVLDSVDANQTISRFQSDGGTASEEDAGNHAGSARTTRCLKPARPGMIYRYHDPGLWTGYLAIEEHAIA
jgi:hypothetical protein